VGIDMSDIRALSFGKDSLLGTSARQQRGFTLVELLVVIAIIGTLIGLLLAAVQMVREAGRRAVCSSNLHQIGQASATYQGLVGCYPSSGWGAKWTGDPDMSFGPSQPGGWIYSILPFLDQESLFTMGRNSSGATKRAALGVVNSTPLAVCYCPTRRAAKAYPAYDQCINAARPPSGLVAKTDYAANGGTMVTLIQSSKGPSEGCLSSYPSCSWSNSDATLLKLFNGVSGERSQVQICPDGASYTYFACEKYLNPGGYETGNDPSDNKAMYQGNSFDTNRIALIGLPPLRDDYSVDRSGSYRFGSAHTDGFNALMCDSAVHYIRYTIAPWIHQNFGNRQDGGLHPPDSL
jgi:prepilin-type N-terminal cleavage/methylation domain-containing protein